MGLVNKLRSGDIVPATYQEKVADTGLTKFAPVRVRADFLRQGLNILCEILLHI